MAFPVIFTIIGFELAGFPPGPPMGLELCPEPSFLFAGEPVFSLAGLIRKPLVSIYLFEISNSASHSRTTPTPLDR